MNGNLYKINVACPRTGSVDKEDEILQASRRVKCVSLFHFNRRIGKGNTPKGKGWDEEKRPHRFYKGLNSLEKERNFG